MNSTRGIEGISWRRAPLLLSDLIAPNGEYAWKPLNDALSGDLPIVLRISCNNPSRRISFHGFSTPQTGIPAPMSHLLRPYKDDGFGMCLEADYDDPLFKLVANNFISELGTRYDGHENLMAVEIGMFGQYGEWTTWRAGKSLRYGKKTQREIISAFNFWFKKTHVLGRWVEAPARDQTCVSVGWEFMSGGKPMGIHIDDLMGPFDMDAYNAMKRLGLLDATKKTLFGGEVLPDLQKACLNERFDELREKIKIYNIGYLYWGYKPNNDQEAKRLRDLDELLKTGTGYGS